MNKMMMAAALVLMSQSIQAEEATVHDVCASFSKMSESIVQARYEGVPMRDIMSIASRHEEQNPIAARLFREVVKNAYNLPDYTTGSHQTRAIRRMSNETYSLCIEHYEPE